MNKKNVKRSIFSYVFIVAVLICLYYAFVSFRNVNNQLSYDEFMSNLNKGTIEKLEITPSMSGQVYILQGKLKGYKDKEIFTLKAPLSEKVVSDILSASENDSFKLKVNKDPEGNSILLMLVQFLLGTESYISLLSENVLVNVLLHGIIIINSLFLLSGEKYYNENVGAE